MDLSETSAHAFIVKVWIEETAEEAGQLLWRGSITHAVSGQKRYFDSLSEIQSFMAPFLLQIGILPAPKRPFTTWLARWQNYRNGPHFQQIEE